MLGKHSPQGTLFQMVTVEELVPQDHFLRQLDAAVDFSFIRERVSSLYCENNGRPSIDPELALRMFILGYLYDIPENRLCDEIRMHAGYRWFCRLDFHDEVPNRTTLVKLRRQRWGPAGVFNNVMRHIVIECVKAGFVSTDAVAIDGTTVNARAARTSLQPIKDPISLEEHLKTIEESDAAADNEPDNNDTPPPQSKGSNSDGKGTDLPLKGQKFSNATHRSRTDPDARLYSKGKNKGAELRYLVHYAIDPKSCVILDTMASRCSGTAEREAAIHMCTNLTKKGFDIKHLLADGGYDGAEYLQPIVDLGITPLIPAQGKLKPLPSWKKRTFNLKHARNRRTKRASVAALNTTLLMRDSAVYKGTYRLRIRIEHLFAEGKEWHGLRRARGYGLMCMNIQAEMTATVQNLKRLVRWTRRRPRASRVVMPTVKGNDATVLAAVGAQVSNSLTNFVDVASRLLTDPATKPRPLLIGL